MIKTTMEASGSTLPTSWSLYLERMMILDQAMRDNKPSTADSTTTKDPNAMDVDAMTQQRQKQPPREKEPLNAEQLEAFKKGKCIKCCKEPAPTYGKRCTDPNPKYKGYYLMPKREKRETRAITTDSDTAATDRSVKPEGEDILNIMGRLSDADKARIREELLRVIGPKEPNIADEAVTSRDHMKDFMEGL
jgi:hypothetical protein